VIQVLFYLVNSQQLPIPPRYDGQSIGNPNAPIMLEEFLDFQCPYCMASYPTIQNVIQYYGPNKLYYVMHVFPLWLHRQAWDAARAAAVIVQYNQSEYFSFVEYLFAHQTEFENAAFFNQTENDLFNLFASFAKNFGVEYSTFITAMNNQTTFNIADSGVHYGITRQVVGTPTFFINGIKAENMTSESTQQEWINLINSVLTENW